MELPSDWFWVKSGSEVHDTRLSKYDEMSNMAAWWWLMSYWALCHGLAAARMASGPSITPATWDGVVLNCARADTLNNSADCSMYSLEDYQRSRKTVTLAKPACIECQGWNDFEFSSLLDLLTFESHSYVNTATLHGVFYLYQIGYWYCPLVVSHQWAKPPPQYHLYQLIQMTVNADVCRHVCDPSVACWSRVSLTSWEVH